MMPYSNIFVHSFFLITDIDAAYMAHKIVTILFFKANNYLVRGFCGALAIMVS